MKIVDTGSPPHDSLCAGDELVTDRQLLAAHFDHAVVPCDRFAHGFSRAISPYE
jgi:hypothetical protein